MSVALGERLLAAIPAPRDAAAAAARERFVASGLPTAKVESWRYSSLRGMEALDPAAGFAEALAVPELAGINGSLLTLAGGSITAAAPLPAGVGIVVGAPLGAIADPIASHESDRAQSALLQGPGDRADAFRALNEAGATTGFDLEVRGIIPGIWRLALQHDSNGLLQVRGRITVRSGASITLVEHWFGSDAAAGLCNALLEIELEPGAELTLLRSQELGAKALAVQRTEIRCGAGANATVTALELGALWSRHELMVELDGVQAEVRVTGLVALQGRQHHDTQLSLTHAVGAARSRTIWKAIANGRSRSVFNGLITVAPGADQTEAHLKTANLLLSPHAEIDTKPELVIEADEVVCSHGATVGQLDDKALFYLRTRGIPEAQARQMLTLAFGGEVLSAIASVEVRAALAERVSAHMPQTT